MLLSDHDIRDALKSERIVVDPLDLDNLQPSSLDVHLDSKFMRYRSGVVIVDPKLDQSELLETCFVPPGEMFSLPPHGFALASTVERVQLADDIAARFEGRSSIGRLGLLPHVAAGFIDPGFQGHVTLELHNVTSQVLFLYPGMPIGQLCFFALSSPASVPYGAASLDSHYQRQPRGPVPSRSHLWKFWRR